MTESTILLIPGLLCDETVWKPTLAALNGKAKVADLSTQDDLTKMAEDCLAAHPGPLRVAGHSMGARVAMEMARVAPDRIEKLALLDTGIHALKEGEKPRRDEIVRFAWDNGMAALAERWLPGMVWEPNRQRPEVMEPLTEMVLSKTPALHERQIRALVNRPDAAAYLSQIACPVLLVVGRKDAWSPVTQHEDMLGLLPSARLEIIESAGHFAPVERPESVTPILVNFLTE
jgi:pimeloyl-ACP methyl ester carboxylesterase